MASVSMYQSGEYLENNADWHVGDSPWKARQVKAILDAQGMAPRNFVEVGCGAGGIVSELAGAFPTARFTGYDVSPQAHELSRDRQSDRVDFVLGDFFESRETYDCLLCMDVFEHVPDYMGFIERLRDRAALAIFHIPMEINLLAILRRGMNESRRVVGHLHYFNRDTALATLADCGYDVIDEFYTESFRLLPRPSLKNKLVGLIYRLMFSGSKDLAVKLLGDCSLIVLAKPKEA